MPDHNAVLLPGMIIQYLRKAQRAVSSDDPTLGGISKEMAF